MYSYPVSTSYRDAKFTVGLRESEDDTNADMFIIRTDDLDNYYLSDKTGMNDYCELHRIYDDGSVAFTIENVIETQNNYTVDNMTIIDTYLNTTEIKSAEIKKEQKKGWYISNDKGVIPDFTLVRYAGDDKGYYYYDYDYDVKDSNESLPASYWYRSTRINGFPHFPLSILTGSDNIYNQPIPNIDGYIVGNIGTPRGGY